MNKTFLRCTAAMAFAVATHGAFAHVMLDQREAAAGSLHKAVLSLVHGCHGSPTVAVRVQIPEGVTLVRPLAKPGWNLTIKQRKMAEPLHTHGHSVHEVASEVAWTGGSLPDAQFDEFRIVLLLPKEPGKTLYIPVVQQCKDGENRWVEVPQADQPAATLQQPAPWIKLLPSH